MAPLHFIFGVHLHQPVGNFHHVFQDHFRDVYLPFLDALAGRDLFPIALHISGPLLEWMEANEPAYLDRVGELAGEGRLELLTSGYDEPVLAVLSRKDRLEQLQRMAEAIRGRFGVEPRTLWLTERVWEPDLPVELAEAGIHSVLVDDRHFLVSGFPRDRLFSPYRTESSGRSVALFPIDQELRYLVPFRPPEDTGSYLTGLREEGHRMAVLVDDGEKFGGWPGTLEWVYGSGWMERFLEVITGLVEAGEIVLSTPSRALREVPSGGLAYLPTASYAEMEGWALPPDSALRLQNLEAELGPQRVSGPEGALLRGSHWRNFLVKYPESNRMHKKALALSELCRARGNPPRIRRLIGRAQCNDAYWHGVFGGLYLRHLRDAIWRNLAEAEGLLREGEGLGWERADVDGDGLEEIRVHSGAFSAVVSPHRGGALEEYTLFRSGVNHAASLTRRREVYHALTSGGAPPSNGEEGEHREGSPSIHDLEKAMGVTSLPPVDREERAMFVDRVLAGTLTLEEYRSGDYQPLHSWAEIPLEWNVSNPAGAVEVVLSHPDTGLLEKRFRFDPKGGLMVSYRWDPARFPSDAHFAPEVTTGDPLDLRTSPEVESWQHPVSTLSKSERGMDETVQGLSTTLLFPVAGGAGRLDAGGG